MTRTHTVFFGDDELLRIRKEYDKLALDWKDRGAHVGHDLKKRAEDRLTNLRIAIDLLAEVAD